MRYRYRDQSGLATFLLLLFALGFILTIVSLGSSWFEYQMLLEAKNGFPPSEDAANANDLRQIVIGLFMLLMHLVTVIVFCMWTYRANANVRGLGARNLTYTPGWSVGWYFIPIMNLWKPYQAMLEIWNSSKEEAGQSSRGNGILVVWWGFWIFSNVVGRIAFKASIKAETIDELIVASKAAMANDLVSLPLYIAVMLVVWQLQKMQEAAVRYSPDRRDDDDDNYDDWER